MGLFKCFRRGDSEVKLFGASAMTALITVDCLGKRFDVRILNQEKPVVEGQTNDSATASDEKSPIKPSDNVTRIEISNDEKANGDVPNSSNGQVKEDDDPVLETVGDLRALISERLQIEPNTAKIIHRGKLIGTKKEERLSTLRFKDKDVVKVMGQQIKTDSGFSSLINYEKNNLVKLNKTFEQNGQDLDLLERNFLDEPDRMEMIKKTEKILRLFNEAAEKHLEAIDGLKIYDDQTSEDQKTRNREKRKQIVDGVIKLLNLNDRYLHRLDDYKFRVEHPDEGR
ncbi:BAG family molecular chaperone regulator 1 [Aphelenchoides bicaudatus]|nr:BAG family molecular chaperone regulator 1 [Aphelenchoides bicaudatus]